MRKLISVILTAAMLMSLVIVGISAAPNAAEVGKVASGYKPEGTGIASLAEATDPAGKYYLTADIKVDATLPITFTGTIDGNGHTVTVSAPVFEHFGGTMKNLIIAGSVDDSAKEGLHTGTAARHIPAGSKAVFENVKNTAAVKGVLKDFNAASPKGEGYDYRAGAGGLVGLCEGSVEITGCANTAAINGFAAGGFIGATEGGFDEAPTIVIKNSVNTGKISDTGTTKTKNNPAVGGFIGIVNKNTTATFEDLLNEGEISGLNGLDSTKATTPAGGVVGYVYNGSKSPDTSVTLFTFKNVTNTAKITGSNQAGGISGWVRANLVAENIRNDGAVESVANYAGGLFGRTGSDGATVKNGESSTANTKITGAVNNGKVLSLKSQTGGIIGYANSGMELYNCTNNADITPAAGQAGGIVGNAGEHSWLKAYYCVNNGKVVSVDGYAGGIASRVQGRNSGATNYDPANGGYIIDIRYCINNGDVEGASATGGIIGSTGAGKRIGLESIMYSVNTGKVTNTGASATANASGAAAGILGYAFGAATEYPYLAYNINTGDVTAKGEFGIASSIAGYFNSDKAVFIGNVCAGKLTADVAGNTLELCWDNASALNPDNVKGNFVLDGSTYPITREWVNEAAKTDTAYEVTKLTAADIASGKLCYELNQAIKAADASVNDDVFYQLIGTDKVPNTVVNEKAKVEKAADGSYKNPTPAPVETDPVTPPTTEPVTPPTTDPVTPPTTEPVTPPTTEPDSPVTGDNAYLVLVALAVAAIAGTACFFVKKKVND